MTGFIHTVCAIVIAISGCSSTPTTEISRVSSISVDGESLVYRGPISAEANSRLFELHQGAVSPTSQLVITSPGGDALAGIELGLWVHENGLDVSIPEYCISSCANYVFTAGNRKTLGNTAAVVWHGGALQKEWDDPDCGMVTGDSTADTCDSDDLPVIQELLTEFRSQEAAFFAKIDVDQRITVLGQDKSFDCRRGDNYIGWYYSLEDLGRLGVRNISVTGDEWTPKPPVRNVNICKVRLAEKN